MGICATPDCGVPGRPFPQCDFCKQRRYCGSHCLVTVTSELIEMIQKATQSNVAGDEDGTNDELIEKLRHCSVICPPCLNKLRPTIEEKDDGDGDMEEQG